MDYKFESYLDLGDIVTIRKLNHDTKKLEDVKAKISCLKFRVIQSETIPLLHVSYEVKTPDNEERNYFESRQDILDNIHKYFTLNSEYEIGQKVWVLKQDDNDVYVYHIKEANIIDITWIRDRVEDFRDIRYTAKIFKDDFMNYFKGTAFDDSNKPRLGYIYNSYEEALVDQKLYEQRYKKIKSLGGFY